MRKSRRKSQRKYKGAKLPAKMKESFLKIIALLIIVGLNWAGLSAVIETVAYFNDTENSLENSLSAGTLDFSLSSSQNNFGPRPEVALNMMPGDSVTREIKIKNDGTLPFQYNVQTEKISGDDDFCAGLQLIAKLNGEIKYDDSLMDFELLEPIEISDLEDNWFFIAYLPYESNFVNKVCKFKFVFRGWQDNIENYGDAGFSDSEEIESKLASWGLRINEVYYRGDSRGEWVELYNQTDQPISISDWIIRDNTYPDTLPSATISANGFGVIITGESTVTGIHPLATIITLDNVTIGNGLADSGDRVILERSDGTQIDAMSYGNDTTIFTLAGVASGHSLARKIAGYDTNQAFDWEDLVAPNPGTNPHLIDGEEFIIEESGEEPVAEENDLEEEIFEEEPIINEEIIEIREEKLEISEIEFSEIEFPQIELPQVELPEIDVLETTTPSTGGAIVTSAGDKNQESGIINQESDEILINEPEELEEVRPLENSDEETVRGRTSTEAEEQPVDEEEVVEEIIEDQLVDEEEPADEEEPVEAPEVIEVEDSGDDGGDGESEGDGESDDENDSGGEDAVGETISE